MLKINLLRILIPSMVIIANTCRRLLIPGSIIISLTYFNTHLFQELWLIYRLGLHMVAASFHLHTFTISMMLLTLSQVIYCVKNNETYSAAHAVKSTLYSLASVCIHDLTGIFILALTAKEVSNTSVHKKFNEHWKAYLSCIMHGSLIFITSTTILMPLIINLLKALPFNTTLDLLTWAPLLATILVLTQNKIKLFYWRANPGRWVKHLALGALSYLMTIATLTTPTNIKKCVLVLSKSLSRRYLVSVGILYSIQPLVEEIIFRTSLFNFLKSEKYTDDDNQSTHNLNLLQKATTTLFMAWIFGCAHAGVRKAKCISDLAYHIISGFSYSVTALITGGIEVPTIWHALHNAIVDTTPMLLTVNAYAYSAMKILMFFMLKPLILTSEDDNTKHSIPLIDKKINEIKKYAQNDAAHQGARYLTNNRSIS